MKGLKFLFCIFSLLICLPVFAQKDIKELKTKFGKISEEELKMTVYSKDSAAPAVILFDKGFVRYRWDVNNGFVVEFERHVRIKILKKEAYDYANISIPYRGDAKSGSRESLYGLKAACYNVEGGKIVESKLESKQTVDEKLTKIMRVKKFNIPNVKEGSIIEYSYSTTDEVATNVPDWQFQAQIPTIWSEYETRIPQYFVFAAVPAGFDPFFINNREDENDNVSIGGDQLDFSVEKKRMVMRDLPALKIEKFMTAPIDYLSRVSYQFKTFVPPPGSGFVKDFSTSWLRLAKELLDDDDFGGALKKSNGTAEIAKTAVADAPSVKEKLAAAYAYIGKNFTAKDYGSLYLTESFKEIIKNKKGTPTELNLLLINVLRANGVTAFPVIISTRSHGRLDQVYPLLERINRVIVSVPLDEKERILVDIDGYPNPIGLLPEDDLNGEGFLVNDVTQSSWVDLHNTLPTKNVVLATLKMDAENALSGEIKTYQAGYFGTAARQMVKDKNAEALQKSVFSDLLADGKIESGAFETPENFNENTLKGSFNIQTKAFVEVASDKIYLNPMLGFGKKENPFANPERVYDVDFGHLTDEAYNLTLTLPDGLKVEEMPKSAKMSLEDGAIKFDYIVVNDGNTLKLSTRFQIKRALFPPEQYQYIRKLYTEMIGKMGEQVVLTKK